jgi:hypothetical protein
MADQEMPEELTAALDSNATCAHCTRSFHDHCFVRGADCGQFSPIIETTGEEAHHG